MYSEFNIDFKASWFATYYTLLQANAPLTMQDIASAIGFTHITVKNIVRELQEHGLVTITANPNDARSKHVQLTTKGKTLYNKLAPVWKSVSKALEQLLTSGHPDLINMLGRIEEEMEKILEVMAGGVLTLDLGTTVANGGGTMTVDGTGTLTLNDATITGGTTCAAGRP